MSKKLAFNENANIAWDLHEKNEIIPLEFTGELKPELYGLEISDVNGIVGGIDVIKSELEVLKKAYIDVIQLEITTENLPTFKDLRKNFTKNRTSAEKLRKVKKSYFLNGGRFVDAIFKNIDAERELMESKLLEAEKFFENQEKEKARLLNESRIEKIRPFVDDVTGLDFSPMSDEDFDDYLLGKKTRFENDKAAAEAEALRIEDERLAEIERQKAIEVENAKLKEEAEAKEKEFEKERAELKAKQDAIELKAKQEREENEKKAKIEADKQDAEIKRIAKELQDKKDTEIKAENERLAQLEKARLAKIKADKAPVKEQLTIWVNSFELPESNVKNELQAEIVAKFEAFKKWSLTQIDNL